MKFIKVACVALIAISSSLLAYTDTFINRSDKTVQVMVRWECGRTETLAIEPGKTACCDGTCPITFIGLDVDGKRIGRWVATSKVIGHFFIEGHEPQSLGYVGNGTWVISEAIRTTTTKAATSQLKLWKIK